MQEQKKIAVFGATGKVGTHFIEQALRAGYEVRAFVRNRTKLSQTVAEKVEIFEGDALNVADVERAVMGADVVVSCLGSTGKHLIMYSAYNKILNAAAKQPQPPRCIMISSVGLGGTSWLIKLMLIMIAGRATLADFERADKRVREETAVPFVLVRPYALTDKPGNSRYHATQKQNATLMRPIPRADVATFMVDAVADRQWDGKRGVQLGGKK
jgi:putative NADH-flavin reductase